MCVLRNARGLLRDTMRYEAHNTYGMKTFLMHTLVFALFLAPLSLAAATCRMGALCNPLQADTLYEFLQGILQAVVLIGFPIIVLFIVWIGFRFVQASAA